VKKLKSKTPDFSLTESEVNAWGCKPVSQKRLQDALELFRLNVYLYPESANAFDSLDEIYTEPGNKKSTVEHYRKFLKLNPQNKNAEQQIKNLQ